MLESTRSKSIILSHANLTSRILPVRGFLGASLGAPDGRVVREQPRLGPLGV
jgi:hypothetical protein